MNTPPSLKPLFIASAFSIATLLAPFAIHAEAIDTDGPDFVESTEVVGKGRFQFETDFTLERDSRNDERTRTFSTPTLLRLGVNEDLELRLVNDFHIRTDSACSWKAARPSSRSRRMAASSPPGTSEQHS